MTAELSGAIGFIGAGNMAEALLAGLLRRKVFEPQRVMLADIRPERLAELEERYRGVMTVDNRTAARQADVLLVAVKPDQVRPVLREVHAARRPAGLVISIAAGISTAAIEKSLGSGARVVRAMPNTPALVGEGVAAICAGANAGEDDLRQAETILSAAARIVRVAETDMDAVTAVSGSGPAYVFFLMEALQSAAEELGLKESVARELISATVVGAGRLAERSDDPPAVLRERVTSKGGTTAAALEVLQEAQTGEVLQRAVKAAWMRSREMAAEAQQ